MSDDYGFTPRLGRIGNVGARKAANQLKKLAKGSSRGRLGGRGFRPIRASQVRHQGRGTGSGAMANHKTSMHQRRVIVKVHIARTTPLGNRGFSAHVKYVQRDGVERDGSPGQLYDREGTQIDPASYNERSKEDSRQFRLIVSPEDADRLPDQKDFTRSFMKQVEADLGARLDWVAVDHHDTANPHTHIIIRGGNTRNGELIIAKDYITHGFRARAQELITRELGRRQIKEIALSRQSEIEKSRWTQIDRNISQDLSENTLTLTQGTGPADRFESHLKRKRLAHLQKLGIARQISPGAWQLNPDWQAVLKDLGRQGDIVRTLSKQMGKRLNASRLQTFDPTTDGPQEITGRLSGNIPGDELRNGRIILVDGLDGRQWSVAVSEKQLASLPRMGGVITVSASVAKLKSSDLTIAAIAASHGGRYSDDIHHGEDPSSTSSYRLAHKRRLEALRRAGFVTRDQSGVWTIPPDFEVQALRYEKSRMHKAISVKSYLPVEALVSSKSSTWLDQLQTDTLRDVAAGFGTEVRAAKIARQFWLRDQQLLEPDLDNLTPARLSAMSKQDLQSALSSEAGKRSKLPHTLVKTESFTGTYERTVDLAQGRYAVIASPDRLIMIPANPATITWKGRAVTVRPSGQRLQWDLARSRGLSR